MPPPLPGLGPVPPRRSWRHGPVPVVGVTGTIAAGKSTFAQVLADRGALVYDADKAAHAALERPEVRDWAAGAIGPNAFNDQGRVDRRALAALVFADEEARRRLEALVHPPLRQDCRGFIEGAQLLPEAKGAAIDAALLLEAGWDDLCDLVVVVDAPEPLRRERFAARALGRSLDQFDARQDAQWPADRKRQGADLVVVNDNDRSALDRAADQLDVILSRDGPSRPNAPDLD